MLQILGLLGMYFDAVVVEVKNNLLLIRLAPTICDGQVQSLQSGFLEYLR